MKWIFSCLWGAEIHVLVAPERSSNIKNFMKPGTPETIWERIWTLGQERYYIYQGTQNSMFISGKIGNCILWMFRYIGWVKKWKMLPFPKNDENCPKGRPGGKMEESASHHFLLRRRGRKRILMHRGLHRFLFLKLWTTFQKIEIFIIFGSFFWFWRHVWI